MEKRFIRHVPMALVALRCLIAAFLVIDALDGKTGLWFVIGFVIAGISDMLDGMVARRYKVVSTIGSAMDGYADVLLYTCILFCIWRVHPGVVKSFFIPILTVGATQVISWLISLFKYSKITSYHTFAGKFWAVTLFVVTFSIFAFNYAGVFLWIAIIVGVASNIEDMMITLVTPYWAHDVSSIRGAFKLRKEHESKIKRL